MNNQVEEKMDYPEEQYHLKIKDRRKEKDPQDLKDREKMINMRISMRMGWR